MLIKQIKGYELEKERPNTSEDFFNRSEVTFVDDGEEKTFHLLYIRYFDELLHEFTPYEKDPLFTVKDKAIFFKDIVGLVCLLKNPDYRHRRRVYINSKEEFANCFDGVDYEKLPSILEGVLSGGYEIQSSINIIKQA